MLNGLIGRISAVSLLKQGLDDSSVRSRQIASQVANASDFANALGNAQGAQAAQANADIETQMVALADEQLRYNAAATLLQRVYGQIRASVRGA
ncbi:MAG TPA: hypothetical protein VF832_16670 [Longimicrobiales bacterium]